LKKIFILLLCLSCEITVLAENIDKDIKNQNEILYSSYAEKIYNTVCIPYSALIYKNKEPLFLKILNNFERETSTIFDEFNYKITENEFVKYI